MMSHCSLKYSIIRALVTLLLIITLLQPSLALKAADEGLKVTYVYSHECLACQQMSPIFNKAMDESPAPAQVTSLDINTREGTQFAKAHGIDSVPAVVINNDQPLLLEKYNNDLQAFDKALREELRKSSVPSPLKITRNVSKSPVAAGQVTADTGVFCRSSGPLKVSVSGGIPEGARVISGEPQWNGVLQPGETRHITYSARLPGGVKDMPPQIIAYDEGSGTVTMPGPAASVLNDELSAAAVLVAGLIAGVNPCLMAVMAFIAGTTLSATEKRIHIIIRIAAFCGGMMAIYLLIGIGLLELMKSVPALDSMLKGAVILALAALAAWSLIDAYRTEKGIESQAFRAIIHRMEPLYRRLSLPTSFAMGVVFGMVKMPCVGGIYIAILGSILDAGHLLESLMYLVLYNLGVIAPVLALGTLLVLGLSPKTVNEFRLKHRVKLKIFTGALLAIMAAGFASGAI